MTDYETQTRVRTARNTQQDFFAGYQPVTPTSERIQAPTFMPYSFDVSAPVETPQREVEQAPSFEVEQGYSFDTTTYDNRRVMETPSIERNTEIVAREEIVATKAYAPKARLNARGKIMVTMFSIVMAIIVALAIYNAVAINGLVGDIAYKEGIVATQTEAVAQLQNTYDNLGADDTIYAAANGEFKLPEESDIVRIEGFEMAERQAEASQSNWFEDFCETIRRLFS